MCIYTGLDFNRRSLLSYCESLYKNFTDELKQFIHIMSTRLGFFFFKKVIRSKFKAYY